MSKYGCEPLQTDILGGGGSGGGGVHPALRQGPPEGYQRQRTGPLWSLNQIFPTVLREKACNDV